MHFGSGWVNNGAVSEGNNKLFIVKAKVSAT